MNRNLEENHHLKQEVFHAPEGYVDAFAYQLQQRLNAERVSNPRAGWVFVWQYITPLALTCLMVIAGYFGMHRPGLGSKLVSEVSSPLNLHPSDAYASIYHGIDEFDEHLLIEALEGREAEQNATVSRSAADASLLEAIRAYAEENIDLYTIIEASLAPPRITHAARNDH